MRRATGQSGNPPGQGPFMKITLGVEGGLIREATYATYPCPGCNACGKSASALAMGKSLEEAAAIDHPTLVARVGPLPRHRQICYGLAVLALADAITQLRQQ